MSQWSHLYHTSRWRRLSEAHRRSEPLCRFCRNEGRVVVGKITDHVNGHPVDETEDQFWSGPFQTLCAEHHESTKKRIELGSRPANQPCDVDGWPIEVQS